MDAAVKNYNGEQTPTAVFQNLILPLAQEEGFSFTEEDYQQYVSNMIQSIDLDEMSQVAGGGKHAGEMGIGIGATGGCDGLGWGVGATSGMGSDGICIIVGYGSGKDSGASCVFLGISI